MPKKWPLSGTNLCLIFVKVCNLFFRHFQAPCFLAHNREETKVCLYKPKKGTRTMALTGQELRQKECRADHLRRGDPQTKNLGAIGSFSSYPLVISSVNQLLDSILKAEGELAIMTGSSNRTGHFDEISRTDYFQSDGFLKH